MSPAYCRAQQRWKPEQKYKTKPKTKTKAARPRPRRGQSETGLVTRPRSQTPRLALSIYLLRHFCCRMYRLAADRQTDRRTDRRHYHANSRKKLNLLHWIKYSRTQTICIKVNRLCRCWSCFTCFNCRTMYADQVNFCWGTMPRQLANELRTTQQLNHAQFTSSLLNASIRKPLSCLHGWLQRRRQYAVQIHVLDKPVSWSCD